MYNIDRVNLYRIGLAIVILTFLTISSVYAQLDPLKEQAGKIISGQLDDQIRQNCSINKDGTQATELDISVCFNLVKQMAQDIYNK